MVRASMSGLDTFGGATVRRNCAQNCGSPNSQDPTRDDILGILLGSQSGETAVVGGASGRGIDCLDNDGSWG